MKRSFGVILMIFPLSIFGQEYEVAFEYRINPTGYYNVNYNIGNWWKGVSGGIFNNKLSSSKCNEHAQGGGFFISTQNNPLGPYPPDASTYKCSDVWNGNLPSITNTTEIGINYAFSVTITNPNTGQILDGQSGFSTKLTGVTDIMPCRVYSASNRYVSPTVTTFSFQFIPKNELIENTIVGNELTIDQLFKLDFQSGNPISGWRYSIDNGSNWVDFPNTELSLQDLGLSESDIPDRKILFQGEACGNIGIYSDIISITLISKSPQLQEPVLTQKTTCSYTNDGSFTLNFDRDLNSGEELVVTLYDGNDDSILVGQNHTTSLVNNSGVYSFSWPESLDAKTYRVKFQSHNGSGGIPETDPSWNSLEFSNPFTVGRATAVNFLVVDSSDENCFDTNDGYIEIQGSRETGRSLLYQYSTNGGSSYTNWRAFLNGNTTKINGLGKGNYRIKVRDSQGCLAKSN